MADDLEGMRILDIGAGDSEFAEKATEFGASVVRVDPTYAPTHLLYERPKDGRRIVAAYAQELPFENGVFDEVIASHSLNWLNTAIPEALAEMLRVTKPWGRVKIAPVLARESHVQAMNVSPVEIVSFAEPLIVIRKTPSTGTRGFRNRLEAIGKLATGHR